MEYIALAKGVQDRQLIPITENVYKHIDNVDTDWYESLYVFNETHNDQLKKTKSLAGIEDITTNKLTWDFDSEDNVDLAKKDAVVLCDRLVNYGIRPDDIAIAFSGNKGFAVQLRTKQRLTREDFKNINQAVAEGLTTNDTRIFDWNRIFRITGTKHNKSGLYKFPITLPDLKDVPVHEIKQAAQYKNRIEKSIIERPGVITIPEAMLKFRNTVAKVKASPAIESNINELDFKFKPKGFSNCKWAIMNGFFENGDRSNCLMALGATCKGLHYPEESAFGILQAAADLQNERFGGKPFPENEIRKNIIGQIWGPNWTGGQYTCKKDATLKKVCESLGKHKCSASAEQGDTLAPSEVFALFENYALNFDKNVLTTGIQSLDERCKFMVGTSAGILAPPGVGKTSLSLAMLNHNSKAGINSIFYSYDMFHSALYLRMLQKHTGKQQEEIFNAIKNKDPKVGEWRSILEKEYKNVSFCFKSGQSTDELEETIIDTEEKIGDKIKLVVVDYNELVIAKSSDPTQASAEVAQRLRQIANDREVAVITLLQPAKLFSNPADSASTYQAAKGSGAIAQSMTLMLGLSRPGFSPDFPEDDRFISINCLKNRNGPLFAVDLGWEGLKGSITELDYDDEQFVKELKLKRKAMKDQEYG